ncbi:MAG: 2-isopropylmalate synthase [bacterium]
MCADRIPIRVFDTTLRDGEQSPGASMNPAEKLEIARQLERLGVDAIEAGFPISSEGDFESVRLVAQHVRQCQVVALARTRPEDIERAWDAVRKAEAPVLHVFIATSPIHMQHKLRMEPDQVVEEAVAAVRRAKSLVPFVEFSAEDATRSDPAFLARIFQAVLDAGATCLNIPDTVGYTVPEEYGRLIDFVRTEVQGIERAVISVHCHNDLGLAVANTLTAVAHGATQVECTMNGIGERAGNCSLEEVVMALKVRKDHFRYETAIRAEHIYPTSRLVTRITGVRVQPNKAVVGSNAFAHEAGIHQDGVLKEKTTYEIMTPESIGIPRNRLVLGKHSGRHAFRERLMQLGYDLADEHLTLAFECFKQMADRKKEVFDEDIEAIIAEEILRIRERYELDFLSVTSGTHLIPTATVQIKMDGRVIKKAEFGDGPVDAAFKAIRAISGDDSKLVRYEVSAITSGTDAQGEVSVRLEEADQTTLGRGASTDIIVASAKAYVNALNKLDYLKKKKTILRGGP